MLSMNIEGDEPDPQPVFDPRASIKFLGRLVPSRRNKPFLEHDEAKHHARYTLEHRAWTA
jgi:hypothetical protein